MDDPRTVESFPRLGKADEYESADGRLFNYKPSSTGVSNFPRRLPSIFETTADKWPLAKLLFEDRGDDADVAKWTYIGWMDDALFRLRKNFRSASACSAINYCGSRVENWAEQQARRNNPTIFVPFPKICSLDSSLPSFTMFLCHFRSILSRQTTSTCSISNNKKRILYIHRDPWIKKL